MPGTGEYVKKAFITAISMIAIAFVVAAALFGLPTPALLFLGRYREWIAYSIGILFLCFLVYKAYKFITRSNAPYQEFRRVLLIIVATPFLIYAGICIFYFFGTDDRCIYHDYTKKLNGGIREIQGKKYNIRMCGNGGDSTSNGDEVRLEIFDEKGVLLAKRYFVVDWGSAFHEPLEYHQDHVIYFDYTNDRGYEQKINMPPTIVDWVRARLPLLN